MKLQNDNAVKNGSTKKSLQAFTLIECLMGFALLAISLSIAIPSYQFFTRRHQTMIVKQQLLRVIRYARSQAMHYDQIITLEGAPTWCQAYQVSIDTKQLKQFPSHIKQGELRWKGFPNYSYLQFIPTGFTNHQNGTFSFYLNEKLQWKLIVNKAGRVRVEWP